MAKKPVQPVRVERGAVKKMVEAAFAELGPQASLQDVKDYVKKKDSAMKEGSVQQAYYAAKGGSSGGSGRRRGQPSPEALEYVKKNISNVQEVYETFSDVQAHADEVGGFDKLYLAMAKAVEDLKVDEALEEVDASAASALLTLMKTMTPEKLKEYLAQKAK